jgi:hypothetical protein
MNLNGGTNEHRTREMPKRGIACRLAETRTRSYFFASFVLFGCKSPKICNCLLLTT